MMMHVAGGLLMAVAAFGQSGAYIAEEVAQRTQTLADGTLSTETTAAGKVYRDAMGRTRTERSTSPDGVVTVEIVDPVAGVRYVLDAGNKMAYRSERAPSAKAARGPMIADAPQAMAAGLQQISVEPLGKRMMDGIEASGQRILTTVVPAAESNDKLSTITTEMWVSRELGITLASRVVEPRMGEVTYRLSNITRREPDPALFQVPEDYKIIEKGAGSNLPLN